MSEQKLKIGITQGDPNGIGWEIMLKALADPRMTEICTPVLYGSAKTADYYRKTLSEQEEIQLAPAVSAHEARRGKINIVNCGETEQTAPGRATPEAGRAAVEALRRAVQDLKEGNLDALVTAPIDKETVQSDEFRHTGHTEYLGAELEGEPLMIMCSEILRIGLVTKHIPVSEISRNITKEKIVRNLETMRRTLIEDFGIVEPRIAVMALNPHAGDGGLLGTEEKEIIKPAIEEAYGKGILAFGPFAADGLFAGGGYTRYDGILAMYHDQGLAPFKSLSPDGVNYTAGLKAVRTSPDHGTAFDIAGQDKADAQSMRNAIYTAIDIVGHRRAWAEWTANPLPHAERERGHRDNPGRETNRETVRPEREE
ncbi:MAG: 4-hydroxythreonine-4-phosphate dehydrogenase PdxA [Alistipes sp.]|nr:4-hydroxythreonine-4-phosphate dehydrogenase PdxA [Alistipes sp.]